MSDVDYERSEISTTIMLIDYTTALPAYQVNAVFREEQSRFYYVRAVVKNVNNSVTVKVSEDKYFVKVTNPCLLPNQVVS